MDSRQKTARIAGVIYVIVIVTSFFYTFYFPSHIVVRSDAAATVNNIASHMSLFRWGIVNSVFNAVATMLLPLALYKLLRSVNQSAAVLMLLFCLSQAVLFLIIILDKLSVLSLLGGAQFLHAFNTDQLNAQVMLSLNAAHNLLLLSVFFGLWLFPLGYLVFKSGFLPKTLGVFLALGGCYYLAYFFGTLAQATVPIYAIAPDVIGEIGLGLWLLIIGARRTVRSKPNAKHAKHAKHGVRS